jgi:hypothetical protein
MDSRTRFNQSWLTEMPSGLGSFETYHALDYSIKDRIKQGSKVLSLGNGLYKITGRQVSYYWAGAPDRIDIAVELDITPQALVVNLTGKDPSLSSKPPYASDLYLAILKDSDRSIRIMSDKQLSDEGYGIWKRLLRSGNTVSVYDNQDPGQTFKTFDTVADLDRYFADDDTNFMRYQYVLSQPGEMLAETRSYFNTRRYRELAGLNLG